MYGNNFYKQGPVGCLLIHGFTGSPREHLELADFLKSKKLTVSIPTLPGHGTHSADLFNYTWRDWFNCVKDAHHEMQTVCKEIFVCGLSMGGTLALHLAAHKPVQGVISLSGAVAFPQWKKIGAKYLKNVIKFRHKKKGEDVYDQSARPKLGSYQRYPLYAVAQLFQLIDHARDDLPEITQPILIIHSRNDHTVDFSNAQIIFDSVSSAQKYKIDLERSYHVITVDVDKEKIKHEILNFIQTHSRLLKTQSESPIVHS